MLERIGIRPVFFVKRLHQIGHRENYLIIIIIQSFKDRIKASQKTVNLIPKTKSLADKSDRSSSSYLYYY